MVAREQTLKEFQREQKELDVLLLERALEEDRIAQDLAKEKEGIVKQSEICLFCNLQDMFQKYAHDQSLPKGGGDYDRILEPRQVRHSLERINFGSMSGEAYISGNMGCAQETFEAILGFLHREYVDPNYLETYVEANDDRRFAMDNRLDDMGCTPKCASHLTFGIQTIDLTSCQQCNIVDDVADAETVYNDQYYVGEMMAVMDQLPANKRTIEEILKSIIKGEGDFRMENT